MTMRAPIARRSLRVASILLAAATVMIVSDLDAGDHWLSRVTIKRPNQPETTMLSSRAAEQGLTAANLTDATVFFDLTISLNSDPQGDDQYPEEGGTADDAQNAYEERIEEFANAIYQSSNGALRIRNVTIFRKRSGEKRVESADVLWNESCAEKNGPHTTKPSGFGKRGEHIWFCTVWPGAALMSDPKGSGYTLAHEWGHYAYGLYDEYAAEQCSLPLNLCPRWKPRGSDTAAVPSIMNRQWEAAKQQNPDNRYLEFSTQNIPPYMSNDPGTNAHKRMFGESGWQTLTRDPSSDPRYLFGRMLPRTRYLALTAPSAPNWIIHDNEGPALDLLDIIWAGNQIVELSIDISGSMAGPPLANAKTGANLLIDTIGAGAAIGVSSFDSFVTRDFAITDIPEPDTGVRAAARAAVNALTSGGATSLYDGLMFSLNDVQEFSSRPSVVFVLSDGDDNSSSSTESEVIAAYQAAGVPIVAFAYGSFAPTGTLYRMASDTGGAFYQSPTTLSDIQAALIAAQAKFSSNVLVSSSRSAVAGNATTTRTVSLDSTLASVRINLSYTGSPADFELHLLRPNGAPSGVAFTCEGNASCTATLDQAFFNTSGYGDYRIQMVNKTSLPKDVAVLISGAPSDAETYELAASFSAKDVAYPADLALTATATRGPAIAGLDVTATVTPPSGTAFDVTLLDDGEGADRIAGDGTYSASIPYVYNGIYSAVVTASNPDGTAQTTFVGASLSLGEDGTAMNPEPAPVPEHFSRVESSSASVTGVQFDDHANSPSPGPCTLISNNNVDTPARIDFDGDADCFRLVPSPVSNPLVMRVTSLTSGMEPVLAVYNHTGVTQIAQVNLATTEAPDSGVIVTIPAASLDASGMFLVVRHLNPSATSGGYAVSAGTKILSDETRVLTITGAGSGDGVVTGNGIDCTVDGGVTSGTCTAIYAPGTTVSLTATPADAFDSATLTGGGCSGESTCAVVMSQARTVTATFETASQLILNGGFEQAPSTGNEAPGWSIFPSPDSGHLLISKNGLATHSGTACAILGGTDLTQYDTLFQYVTIPEDATAANLTFWTRIATREIAGQGAYDFLWVVLHDADGNEIATPVELSNENANGSYVQVGPVDLSAYAGTPIRISFVAYTDNVFETRFLIDDVSLVAVRPDTGPRPRVTAPTAGAILSGTVSVTATATPNGSPISSLSIEIDGVQKATTTTGSLTYSWDTMQVGNGQHSIVAKARDLAGNEASSPVVTVTTSNLLAPRNVIATATSASNVSVTWDALDTASSYQIFRRANGGPYELAGTSVTNSFAHSNLPANAAFMYQVRAVDASGIAGPPSAGDLATTVRFVDPSLLTGATTIKAIHLTQLRTAVNAVRTMAGLPIETFTDTVVKGSLMRSIYLTELRTALDAARAAAGLPPMTWGAAVIPGTTVKATHLQKLREGVE